MNGRVVVVCLLLLLGCSGASAQNAPQRDPQAIMLLQKSFSLLSGGSAIQDVTLTGTMRRVAGSTDDSGTGTLEGTAAGDSLTVFSLPSGNLSQSRQTSVVPPTGSWEGPDGSTHAIASHNLFTDPTWFYPALLFELALGNTDYGVVYVGYETRSGISVEHLRVYFAPSASPVSVAQRIARLSQTEIYLDATTNLPVAVVFFTHPDHAAEVNIPVEVRFSGYVREGGRLAPGRIARYLQGGLLLDIQVTGAQFNTGLSSGNMALP